MRMIVAMIVGVSKAIGRSYSRWSTGAPFLASNASVERRQRVCLECRYRDKIFCNRCNCLITVKTQLRAEKCPAGFWLDEI